MAIKRQTIAVIVAFIIFVLVGAFIIVRIAVIYRGTTGYANVTTKPAIECAGYMYSITNIDYSDGQLSFMLENKEYSDYEIDKIIITTNETMEEVNVDLIRGGEKQIAVEMAIDREFSVFPKGCQIYAKEFTVR